MDGRAGSLLQHACQLQSLCESQHEPQGMSHSVFHSTQRALQPCLALASVNARCLTSSCP